MLRERNLLLLFPIVLGSFLLIDSCSNPTSSNPTKTVAVTGVTLNYSDWTILENGTDVNGKSQPIEQLVATVSPSNATNKSVTWHTSDPTDTTVSSDGLVTWIGPENSTGTMPLTVTATTADGNFTATCTGTASCPMVYVGNGHGKFTYLTDLQGPIIGLPPNNPMSRNTALFAPDYVVLHGLEADRTGTYRIKLREIQAEIDYIDSVRVLPVYVPDGYTIASSSAQLTYGNGYDMPHHFYTLQDPKRLVAATDWKGENVTSQLASTDGVPAPISGIAVPYYTLDFGKFDPAHAKLVIRAWALYSPSFGAKGFVLPSVSVKDAAGYWTVVKQFGIPAGDEKTMVWDISGLVPSGDHQIRLSLGERPWVRWVIDSVRLDDSAPVRLIIGLQDPARTAMLSSGGIATMTLSTVYSRGVVRDNSLPSNGVGLGRGRFTRYGTVGPLLSQTDDKFVIMGMGDQVLMTFGPFAPAATGYHRAMVMKIVQYYKAPYVNLDVAELPFRGMSSYPYPATEHYPKDASHEEYLASYDTRVN